MESYDIWRELIYRYLVLSSLNLQWNTLTYSFLVRHFLSWIQSLNSHHTWFTDEPTNHLDMASIDALARAIKDFEGGVVIVSHDFRLISQVAEELWEVADHKIRNLTKEDISIVDYKQNLVRKSVASIEKAKLISKSASKTKT
jgi:ATP-binding cassette subfamily F protein 2